MKNNANKSNNLPKPVLMPFPVKVGTRGLQVNVESDGRGGMRYYFIDPTRRAKNGKRFKKVPSYSKDEITQKARTMLQNLDSNTVVLTREQYTAYEDIYKRLARMEKELLGTGMSLEVLVGQVLPTMKLILPHDITVSQALEAGRAFFVPPKPMTVNEVMDGLLPNLSKNSDSKYVRDIERRWECLRLRHGNDFIHKVQALQLEQLLADYGDGKFLTETEKQAILARKSKNGGGADLEKAEWYEDKSIKHLYDAWRRLFIRAAAIGAWPSGAPLPTEIMERPKADQPELDAIIPEDWELLLTVLDEDELRYVSLVISDIRSAELGRLNERHVLYDQYGIPISISVPAIRTKGKKGMKKGRIVTLLPNASVILHLNRAPKGGPLLPMSAEDMQARINAKARKLGIEPTHNFVRRAHDTYWYGLKNVRHGYNHDSSHDKQMIDGVYRGSASFEDCVQFYRALPPTTPAHLVKWVHDWVEGYRRAVRGGPVPLTGLPGISASETPGQIPAIVESPLAATPNGATSHMNGKSKTETVNPKTNGKATATNLLPTAGLPGSKPANGTPVKSNVELAPQSGEHPAPEASPDPLETAPTPPTSNAATTPQPAPSLPSVTKAETTNSSAGGGSSATKSLPEPPRLPNGRVDWQHMKKEFLAEIFKDYKVGQIAQAWGISSSAVSQQLARFKSQNNAAESTATAPMLNNKPATEPNNKAGATPKPSGAAPEPPVPTPPSQDPVVAEAPSRVVERNNGPSAAQNGAITPKPVPTRVGQHRRPLLHVRV